MPARSPLPVLLVFFVGSALASLGLVGCVELREEQGCTNSADYDARNRPFHTIEVDTRNDFHGPSERFRPDADSTRMTGYVSWDECRIYFGFKAPVFGAKASPFRYLALYIDTDPLGDEGSVHARRLAETAPGPLLPFKADYLVEIRTDGRTMHTADSTLAFQGNAQLFRRSRQWTAGLIRHWESAGDAALHIGLAGERSFVEFGLERRALDNPCAIQATAWITDTRRGARTHHWPPRALDTARDSPVTQYYGFQLLHGVDPNAQANLNRTAYNDVGECAFGPEEEH